MRIIQNIITFIVAGAILLAIPAIIIGVIWAILNPEPTPEAYPGLSKNVLVINRYEQPTMEQKAYVTDITDGDTITVNINGVIKTIRLSCFDAPEMDWKRGQATNPSGIQYTQFLSNVLPIGTQIELTSFVEDGKPEIGFFGRQISRITVNGVYILELLPGGYKEDEIPTYKSCDYEYTRQGYFNIETMEREFYETNKIDRNFEKPTPGEVKEWREWKTWVEDQKWVQT